MVSTYAQGQTVLRFQGRMDTARCDELTPEVRAALTEPNQLVVFDVAEVDFVSSAFLRLCVYAQRQAGAYGFQLVNAGPLVRRVFKIAALDNMLA